MDDDSDFEETFYAELLEPSPKKSIFVIGDTHFQHTCFEQGEALRSRCVELVKEYNPAIIILLGDILDTNEIAKQSAFQQAYLFIKELSEITKLYVIMGNHDLINQSQYLTDNHFFNPYKAWPNVTIVDKPIAIRYTDSDTGSPDSVHLLVMCPYTPPERLIEALDTLGDQGIDWTEASVIFAHHEVRGVSYRGRPSTNGVKWLPRWPPLVLGHIHAEGQIGENVYYVGSSRQVDANEPPDKYVWLIKLEPPNLTLGTFRYHPEEYINKSGMWVKKIPVGLKGILEVHHSYDDIHTFDFDALDTHYIKLHITTTPEQTKVFKKTQLHSKLTDSGVRIQFAANHNSDQPESALNMLIDAPIIRNGVRPHGVGAIAFDDIFYSLVQTKSDTVKEVYDELYGGNPSQGTELIFNK